MGKIWVLETQTKGTGANMVPLERVQHRRSDAVPGFSLPKLKATAPPEPDTRQPRLFRVIDVMTRELLGEGVDARGAVEILENVRSIVDVTVSVWDAKARRWRMLTFAETEALWKYRRSQSPPRADSATH